MRLNKPIKDEFMNKTLKIIPVILAVLVAIFGIALVSTIANAQVVTSNGSESNDNMSNAPITSHGVESNSSSSNAPTVSNGSESNDNMSNAPITSHGVESNSSSSNAPTVSNGSESNTNSGSNAPAVSNGTESNTSSSNVPTVSNGKETVFIPEDSTPTTPTNPTKPSNGGSRGSNSSGGYVNTIKTVSIDDFKIVNVNPTTLLVTFTTSSPVSGQIVFGPISMANFEASVANFGYANASTKTSEITSHSITINVKAGTKYFIRPVVTLGNSIFYGQEVSFGQNSNVAPKTAVVDSKKDDASFGSIKVTPVETSKNKDVSNTASASQSAGGKIGGFFKKVWNFLLGR
jgi:hypothetical protein